MGQLTIVDWVEVFGLSVMRTMTRRLQASKSLGLATRDA